MLKAYKLSHDAESACSELYPSSQTNDESDACRHFVWAALLQNELGTEFASEVLVAHELNPKQPQNQLEMDMHNNKLGREIGQKLNAAKNFSTEKALNAFQENLKAGKIVVIRKGGGSKK